MALSSETSKTIFNCNGSTVDFDFDFKVFESTDLEVILYTIADGTETTLTVTTHYSVSALTETGGRVTTVATYSNAYKLIVRRKQPLKQEIDYTQNDILSTEVLEEQLDKNVMMVQWLYEQIARSILRDSSQTSQLQIPAASDGKLLGWDGTDLANIDVADLGVVAKATQTQAEAGTDDDTFMTPLKTAQAITALAPSPTIDTAVDLGGATPSDTKISSQKAIKTYADTKIAATYLDTDTSLTANSDTKIATQKATKAYADSKIGGFKMGTFTRDMTASSGDVAITGVGFQPKMIIFFATGTGTPNIGSYNGFDDGTNHSCVVNAGSVSGGNFFVSAGASIYLWESSGVGQDAHVKTMDADGFTITWAKSGSPTAGTGTVVYLAFK